MRRARWSFLKVPTVSGGLAMIAIVGVVLIRTINLGSDIPKGIPGEEDYGIYADEGYKTLSARNMAVFGTTKWHPGDDYHGWLAASPITQGAFYFAFMAFGQTLETARMVSVAWFAILLIAFGIAYYGYRSSPLFWAGLLMLGFQYILWVHSRTAILEIATLSIFYAVLLLLRKFSNAALRNAIVIAVAGVVAIFGVKQDASIIVAPAFVGALAVWAVQKERTKQFLLFLLVGVGVFLVFKALWKIGFPLPFRMPGAIGRTDLFPPTKVIERLLVNPILKADPFLVILGHACAVSALLYRPKFFENNPYRASLMSMVFFGIASLATVPPPLIHLRYGVVLLPAFVLLVLEWWIAQKENSRPLRASKERQLSAYAAIVLVFILVCDLVFLIGWSLSPFLNVPEPTGGRMLFMFLFAAALAFLVWKKRDLLLSASVLRVFIFTTMAGFAVFNGCKVTRFLARPSWQIRTISTELTKILPKGATVAGDWIPLFAIGTNLRVLYTNPVFNRPERFKDLRPSHFLDCETEGGKRVKESIEHMGGVRLRAPLLESQYAGVSVTLYPFHYEQSEFREGAQSGRNPH
jgi:hypothetical protein